MIEAEIASDEARRVATLYALNVLDTPAEERFDRITRTAARLLNFPIALVSLLDTNRQWFKSSVGLLLPEVSRNDSFCAYTIGHDEVFIVRDAALDARFTDNPLVTGEPYVRFYAGYPLSGPDGSKLGTLCVMDLTPRRMGAADLQVLQDLAAWAEHELIAGSRMRLANTAFDSEMRLKAVLDNVAEGVIAFNERGGVESINPAAERMFGYKSADITGQSIKRLIPEPFRSENTSHLSSRLLEGDSNLLRTHSEVTGRHRDGSAIPMDMSVSEVWLAAGKLFVSIVHDVSRRRAAEEKLLESDILYHSVLTTVEEGVILQDPAGTILGVNAGVERILEVPPGQLLGRAHILSHSRALHEDGQAFPVETHPAMLALHTGETQSGVIMGLHMPSGFLKWVSINSQPVYRPGDARPFAVVSSITDITEQKAAQDKLVQAEERYLTVCDSATDFISVHDLKGVYLFASSASLELLGHRPDELIKSNIFSQIHPEDADLINDMYRKLVATGARCSVKYRIKRKSDEYVWLETHARAVAGLHVGDLEILCVSHKLRDRRNMRASMHEEVQWIGRNGKAGEPLALRDELTSLLNRRAIDELLNFKLASPRAANYPFGCLILDIDQFGSLNDTYGREAGDSVLQAIGQLLAESCRAEDYVSRYKDDEFVIVLPNTDASGTVLVAERIVNTVRVANWPNLPQGLKITVSIGGTCIRRPSDLELAELLQVINSQLDQAKTMGRDRLVMNARQIDKT